jgi:peptidoglycan/xylan/chitin deacetylase (PgdA/CDA1 family)
MGLKHQILAAGYPILYLGNLFKKYIWQGKSGRLRVLVYHDVGPDEMKNFENQIKWLVKSWKFVDAASFSAMMAGEKPIRGNNVLLTFDDGFFSNRLVAEKILDPLGIKAIFFVVVGFIEQSDSFSAHNFIAKGIRSDMEPSMMPKHWLNMSWIDLGYLIKMGHTIGAHTESHPRLSGITDQLRLESEIIDSANRLEKNLGVSIEHFAFTFGDSASLSKDALSVAKRRFKYIYTSLRGDNSIEGSTLSIYRETVSPNDSRYLVGSFLFGGVDWVYRKAKVKYGQYL